MPVMGNYLLYAVAGYLLSTLKITKKQRVILYILGFIGLAAMLVGTHILSRDNGAVSSLFKGYQNLPVFLYSIAIFLFAKELSRHKFLAKLQRVIGIIAKYSFSLYLTHRFVLIYASSIAINNIGLANGSLAYVLVSTTITIVCCIAIASLLRKLPFGKLILP